MKNEPGATEIFVLRIFSEQPERAREVPKCCRCRRAVQAVKAVKIYCTPFLSLPLVDSLTDRVLRGRRERAWKVAVEDHCLHCLQCRTREAQNLPPFACR